MNRIRAMFAVPSMRGGGAERVISLLLAHLDPQRFDLHLAVVRHEGPHLDQLPAHVTVHDLGATRVLHGLLPMIRLVRRIRPDAVLSTVSHLNLAMGMIRPAFPCTTRLVVRESATSRQILAAAGWLGLRRAAHQTGYRRADAIICQTEYMRRDLHRCFGVPLERTIAVPNPIDLAEIDRLASGPRPPGLQGPGPHVIAVGRLAAVKGLDRLLAAFPQLLRDRPQARLWLVGLGPCEPDLRRLAADLQIAQHVRFVGYQRNPYRWLRAADLMAMTSLSESCPNALLESVACLCPPIVQAHPGGTRELLSCLGLADRFVTQLDTWSAAWFRPLPPGVRQRLAARHDAGLVARRYAQVLAGHRLETDAPCEPVLPAARADWSARRHSQSSLA